MKLFILVAMLAPTVFGQDDSHPLSVSACGRKVFKAQTAKPYIAGGQEATPNSHPWQVSLQFEGRHTCGGTIISNRYILTAANCITGDAGKWAAVLGKHSLSKSETGVAVSHAIESIIKPSSNGSINNANDVALLKMKKPVQFNNYIQPACLADSNIGTLEGRNAIVTGWGSGNRGGAITDKLYEVQVSIMSDSRCHAKYPWLNGVDRQICAGDNGEGNACQGDSGGPLMVLGDKRRWTLIGVDSWGYGCGKGGVYTTVPAYFDWIKKNAV